MPSKMQEWFQNASVAEKKEMAKLSGVSENTVYKFAQGIIKAALPTAINTARAMRIVRHRGGEEAQDRLPIVTRGDAVEVCAACPYYQACARAGITENGENESLAENE